MQSLLNFLPLSFVASNRLLNLNNFVPPDVSDPDLEGVSIEILDKLVSTFKVKNLKIISKPN